MGILTTTKHLLRRAVNGAEGKACRPLTAMAAGARKMLCFLPEVVTLHFRKQNAYQVRQRACNNQRQEEIQDDVHTR